MQNRVDCPVCRLVRFYLLISVPLIAAVGLSSMGDDVEGGFLIWFARVELIDFLAWGALAACIIVVGYRAVVEFWVPRRRAAKLDRLLHYDDAD